jgi:hypothetical protein
MPARWTLTAPGARANQQARNPHTFASPREEGMSWTIAAADE